MATESVRKLLEAATEHRNEAETGLAGQDATSAGVFALTSVANSLLAAALLELDRLELLQKTAGQASDALEALRGPRPTDPGAAAWGAGAPMVTLPAAATDGLLRVLDESLPWLEAVGQDWSANLLRAHLLLGEAMQQTGVKS